MKQKKVKSLNLIVVVIYSILYITASFFVTDSVALQTFYNIFIIAIILLFIDGIEISNTTLKPFLLAFWIGQLGLYVINFFLYKDLNTWLNNFNNYGVLIPVYIVSIFIGLFLALKK